MKIKDVIIHGFVVIFARSKLLVKLSRQIVKKFDNDSNSNMRVNGEQNLIGYLSNHAARIFKGEKIFFDVGGNIGNYTQLLYEKFKHAGGGAIFCL